MRAIKSLVVFFVVFSSGCALEPATEATAEAVPTAATPGASPVMEFAPLEIGEAPAHDYSAEQIARGGFIVGIGMCNDCHTPWNFDPELGGPIPDMSRMLSGHPRGAPDPQGTPGPNDLGLIGPTSTAFGFPFGVVYSANLTPDLLTGTGSWTEEMFVGIFRKAKHLGGDGRTVLPPMPWPVVAGLPDEDLIAIFAYLRSIPPIRNAVPSANVPEDVINALGRANEALLQRMKAQAGTTP